MVWLACKLTAAATFGAAAARKRLPRGWRAALLIAAFLAATAGRAVAAELENEPPPPLVGTPADLQPMPPTELDDTEPPAEVTPSPAKAPGEEATSSNEKRDPFRLSARLLREVQKGAGPELPAVPPEPTTVTTNLPDIRMTGVMIVGDKKMATAEIGSVGTVTLVQGEPVLLPPDKQGERLQITVVDIGERSLTIKTGDGSVVRAQFK